MAWVGLTRRKQRERLNSKSPPPVGCFRSRHRVRLADGVTKLIFDKEEGPRYRWCHRGYQPGELLGESVWRSRSPDAEDIALTIHAHPTLHESVGRQPKCSRLRHRPAETPRPRRSNFSFAGTSGN
ncbi:hypothetical protein ACNKHX_00745 [Shigella flexneri]